MKAGDCKIGDWLVIHNDRDSLGDIKTPTIAKIKAIYPNHVGVTFGKSITWNLDEVSGVLYSDNGGGKPAIPLEPTGFDTYKDRCRVITKDHEFDVTREVGEEIAKHYGLDVDKTQDVPKLHIGDKFEITNEMASRKSTSPYSRSIWHLVGHSVEVKSVGAHSDIGGFYEILTDGLYSHGYRIRTKDVDPYLSNTLVVHPEVSALKPNPTPRLKAGDTFIYTKEMWEAVGKKKDGARDSIVGVLCEVSVIEKNRYSFSRDYISPAGVMTIYWQDISTIDPYLPSQKAEKVEGLSKATNPAYSFGLNFDSLKSHMEGGVKVHEDVRLKSAYLFSKPSFMTRLLSKLKKLRMSKDDRDLFAVQFIDENGDPTTKGLDMMAYLAFNEKENRAKLADYARQLKNDEEDCEDCCDCE